MCAGSDELKGINNVLKVTVVSAEIFGISILISDHDYDEPK